MLIGTYSEGLHVLVLDVLERYHRVSSRVVSRQTATAQSNHHTHRTGKSFLG